MKKWLTILLFFVSGFFLYDGCYTQAAVNQDGSVTIDANNFPDPWFREAVKRCDENSDGRLSDEERKKIGEIAITMTDGSMNSEGFFSVGGVYCIGIKNSEPKRKKLQAGISSSHLLLDGISCFENLTDLSIKGFEKVSGSLKANKKLVNVELIGSTDETGEYGKISHIQSMLPLKQIQSLSIEGIHFRKFSLKEAVNLYKLSLYGMEIDKIDLSAQKELKVIELHETELETLDLRKNKKLQKVVVTSGIVKQDYDTRHGDEQKEKKAGKLYYDYCGVSCKVLLPANNRIQDLTYFTADKQIDLSQCKRLKFLHIREGVKMKFPWKKLKKTNKNTFGFITVSGAKRKVFKNRRKGNFLYLTGKKNWKNRRSDVAKWEDQKSDVKPQWAFARANLDKIAARAVERG